MQERTDSRSIRKVPSITLEKIKPAAPPQM